MRKRRAKRSHHRRRGLAGLGEAAHAAQVFVGRNVNAPNGTVLKRLSDKEVLKLASEAAKMTTGATTVLDARGRYVSIDTGEPWPVEDSFVLQHVVPAESTSCSRLVRRMKRVGQRLANMGQQQSVLVEVHCADGSTDAALIRYDGRTAPLFPLVPVEKTRQRKRRAPARRAA